MVRNRLELADDGTVRAVATDETETIPCGLVLRSVGYRGLPVDGVPFDDAFRARRTRMLIDLLRAEAPDVVVTEQFPFGRTRARVIRDGSRGLHVVVGEDVEWWCCGSS